MTLDFKSEILAGDSQLFPALSQISMSACQSQFNQALFIFGHHRIEIAMEIHLRNISVTLRTLSLKDLLRIGHC